MLYYLGYDRCENLGLSHFRTLAPASQTLSVLLLQPPTGMRQVSGHVYNAVSTSFEGSPLQLRTSSR